MLRTLNRTLLFFSWVGMWSSVGWDDWKFIISLMITILTIIMEWLIATGRTTRRSIFKASEASVSSGGEDRARPEDSS